MIKIGSDFSGVGAFNQALTRLGIPYKEIFACDMDKYARQTFIHNYGEPGYYPENVYDREIPNESLDIYMTSPPCQAFSLAGRRKGEEDKRGILFYNSHEFIKENKPRYFIFENVKGLLSDDKGNTFAKWVQYLGGKSVNGNPTLFPHEESLPYHIYWKVLNAKDYNIPQNRERVFIIGIRDDEDNNFTWPKEMFLERRLRDVLESDVDEKYYLSEKMVEGLVKSGQKQFINQDTQASQVYSPDGLGQTLCAGTHGYANGYVSIGAIRGRNPDNPTSRISGQPTQQMLEVNQNGTSNAMTTVQKDNFVIEYDYPKVKYQLTGGKWDKTHQQSGRVYDENGISHTIHTMGGGNQEPKTLEGFRIRKLTPRECFRLMDFPDTFSWPVSDTQAYKQAGNSICVGVLASIISKLKL